MPAPTEMGNTVGLTSGVTLEWLGNSVWQVPEIEVSKVNTWPSITAMSYHRDAGEAISRGDRHRVVLTPHQLSPRLVQVEQGPTREIPFTAPGSLTFCPPGLTIRTVLPEARLIQVLWDTDLYSALLPELGAAASRFEYLYPLQDPLLSQIVATLSQEIEGGVADRILVESLSTAMCIGIAQRFVGHLSLPTSKGLSPERLANL